MRNVELRLISALMKNSRRSDRELARTLGTSQPTITRMRDRLERNGCINEYTMVPDFRKLGFQILAITFAKLKKPYTAEEIGVIRSRDQKEMNGGPSPVIVAMTGMGTDADRVIISLHRTYSEYSEYIRAVRQHPLVEFENVKSFLVNIFDDNHFLPLTFSRFAQYLCSDCERLEAEVLI